VTSLAELTAELVAIDSVKPGLVPDGAGEAAIARFVAEWCARAGLDVEVEEPAPGRPNVIAVARGSGGGSSLMLNAHMDTVGVAGMEAPFSGRIEDGRLYMRSCAGDPEVVGVPFWADSALLAAAGIPTVLYGPRGEGAHAEVEWVDLASAERCLEVCVAVARELCA